MDIRKNVNETAGFVWELLKIILVSVALIIPIRLFLVQPFYVQGASMYPNFIENDYLLVDEITYGVRDPLSNKRIVGGRPPQRGEIVVFSCNFTQCGNSKGDYLIKRVVGLPGETVVLRAGRVYIVTQESPQGIELIEPYVAPTRGYFAQEETTHSLAQHEYFVLGDNRDVSFDSEDFGPIPLTAIIGKVWVRGWPFNRLTSFTIPSYPL